MRNSWRADLDRILAELGHDKRPPRIRRLARTDAKERLRATTLGATAEQIGRVEEVGDGIALVSGLPNVRLDELAALRARASSASPDVLDRDRSAASCSTMTKRSRPGDRVGGTGEVVRVPVGPALLGRIVDPLGRPLDGSGPIDAEGCEPIERPAPAIIDRDLVTEPVQTGLLVVDTLFALGRGQRELIIGDRAIGKTHIADRHDHQSEDERHHLRLRRGRSEDRPVSGASSTRSRPTARSSAASSSSRARRAAPGLQWIAPFAGFTMAEYFRDRGQHALVVIDDLTKHAATHREIALLTRQSPGREAYPGDVFYVHARLLERAAKLVEGAGGGSLTALPIAETDAGNLSAYIPTNLISITDGQIVLDAQAVPRGAEARRRRRHQRQPRRRQDPGAGLARGGGDAAARLCPVPRTRDVHPLRRRHRCPSQGQDRARAAYPRNSHPTPVRVTAACGRSCACTRIAGRPSRQFADRGRGKFRSELPGWLDRAAAPIVDEIERTGRLDDAKSAELKTIFSRASDAPRTVANHIRAKDQVMAERLADIVTQIQNVRQLAAVVTAMRGIAASRAQKS